MPTHQVAHLSFHRVRAGIVIFAALVYYAERSEYNPDNSFSSIPSSMWWAVVYALRAALVLDLFLTSKL